MKMNVSAAIKRIRKEKGLSQRQLAELIGVTEQTISNYESGRRSVELEKLEDLADALNVSVETFISSDERNSALKAANGPDTLPKGITPISQMPHHYVPLIGSVAAGTPIFAEQCYDCYVDAPRKADFALTVEGDSMVPTLCNGDTIYIHQQDVVEEGEIGVVLIDDSACVKHIYHHPEGLMLISDNPAYPPRIVKVAEHEYVKVLGKVCGFTRMW